MIKSSLFLAIKALIENPLDILDYEETGRNILALGDAIAANLEIMSREQTQDFIKSHLEALGVSVES